MTTISSKSIKNAVEVLTNADPELNSMIVATYPDTYPHDGRIVKAHHKALKKAIKHKLGDYSYFTAIEYQKRGAPHFHQGSSISLSELGEIVTLKRKNMTRRLPTFQTVKPMQDWAFETWLEIISKPDISYEGQPLDWSGLDYEDIEKMRTAYYHYNAGFSWEVMRERDGAKRYFVKELTGLKRYQKTIPQGFEHPGRHFLYSQDMIFDPENGLTFVVSEGQLRELLKVSGWQFLPEDGKPLYKYLWNSAANLAVALIEAGFRPIKSSLDALRKYADARMMNFADLAESTWKDAAGWANLDYEINQLKHWEEIKRRIAYKNHWEQIFSTGPP